MTLHHILLILFLLLLSILDSNALSGSFSSFDQASMTVSANDTLVPVDFTVSFRTTRDILGHEFIAIVLPRFTKYLYTHNTTNNITLGDLIISPSYYFHAAWIEGLPHYDDEVSPYLSSQLHLQMKGNLTLPSRSTISLTVHKENGIGAICGFPSFERFNDSPAVIFPFRPFKIATITPHLATYVELVSQLNYTYDAVTRDLITIMPMLVNVTYATHNTSYLNNDSYPFDTWYGMGKGCASLTHCNKQGRCDYCLEKCHCFNGFGASSDVVEVGRDINADCSSRTCPSGRAIGDLALSASVAHKTAECSNMGKCNRATGQCQCFDPFTGSACEKLRCPNDCSGHGRCVSMQDLARISNLQEVAQYTVEYGSGAGLDSTAWDYQTMYACVCDSSWVVGFGAGETQLGEYFGPDCSQRRCPSGDDPFTSVNEENCLETNQIGSGPELGESDNKCHVDCSNRGVCNYKTGLCSCFDGSWGEACDNIRNAGRHTGVNNSIIVEGN